MRFEEAYSGWTERHVTQEEAGRLLGVCARTFRRYIDRYEEEGLDGLLDKRLTQVSHRRAPVDEVMRLPGEPLGKYFLAQVVSYIRAPNVELGLTTYNQAALKWLEVALALF